MSRAGHSGADWTDGGSAWLSVMRSYLIIVAAGNLIWEVAQLPLYTIWTESHAGEIAFAVVHCTGGDVLIATVTLVLALLVTGSGWPVEVRAYRSVAALTLMFGVGYTIFSEWLNATVRKTWAYSELMPTIPPLDVGLSPIAQWIVIPLIGFWWSRRLIPSTTSRQGAA